MTLPTSLSSVETVSTMESYQGPPIWLGDGEVLESPGSFWGAAAVELRSAPALLDGQDAATAGRTQRVLAERIVRGLRGWENMGGLEVRYVWGQHPGIERLRVLLIARAVGGQIDSARAWAAQMIQNVTSLFPDGYHFDAVDEPLPSDLGHWVEIERAEETRQPGPFVPPGSVGFYYLVHPLGGSGQGWGSLPKALARVERPGFLSIALVPTTLTDMERGAIDHICSIASYLSQTQQTYDFFGNPQSNPPDAGAEAVHRAWARFTERSGVIARIGIAAHQQDLQRVASLVGSIVTEGSEDIGNPLPSKFKLVQDIGDYESWETATLGLPFPRGRHPVWNLPEGQAPVTLERMPYFFTEQEAGGIFVLPVPDAQGVPGVPLARRAADHRETVSSSEPVGDAVVLGSALHRGAAGGVIALPLRAVNRHTLVVGEPGSGKTTTVLSLLARLWREHRVPFLVLEPAKTEYRTLLRAPGLSELQVITLGNESVSPLRLNPLEPPQGVRCEVHQSAVLAALKMALPLFTPQPELLAKALPEAYYRAGWDDETTMADSIPPPTLRDLGTAYREIFARAGYEGEARNVGRGFEVRLDSLLSGSRGRLLDTMSSTDFSRLLTRPTVIEMNDISDADERAVLAAFVLDRVRAEAKRRGSTSGTLRHVTVIEEAHRLLAKANTASADGGAGVQVRAESIRAFCEAIAELRSLGEGFVLSSQSPSALADAAVANCGTRILHRMERSDDRRIMLDDLDADEQTRAIAARLRQGEAVLRWPERDETELVRVEAAAGIDSGQLVTDEVVAEHMRAHREQVARVLPFALCTSEVCATGCTSSVRRAGARAADMTSDRVRAQWRLSPPVGRTTTEAVIEILAGRSESDVRHLYCSVAHSAANGHAFTGSHDRDRAGLVATVREVVRRGVV